MIMLKRININLIDHLSLILVLTFFILHKIYLVFFGIVISIYQLNKNSLDSTIDLIKNKYSKNDPTNINKDNELNYKEKDLYKLDYNLKLVEKVEELGVIPSLYNNIDDKIT